MVVSHTITMDLAKRGVSVSDQHRAVVERLDSRAREVQRRFELAESTAFLLEEMLDAQSGLAEAIENTYEGNAFVRLRFQLFRLLMVDLCAAVLDHRKGVASIRKLIEALETSGAAAITSLKEYYADRACLKVVVTAPELDDAAIEQLRERLIDESVNQSRRAIDAQWQQICVAMPLLDGDAAERIKWARNKAVAHYEKSSAGSLVALHDNPPYGSGKLTWLEPIQYLRTVKPLVYDVVGIITSTSWDDGPGQFYARAFWDRFKNGGSKLSP